MIDLHTHSTASDGTDSPAELVQRALSIGLEALALTDHDTFSGSDEALPLAAAAGLPFVRALELSTRRLDEPDPASRSVHILGFFFSEPDPGFRAWLETLKDKRRARNRAMAAKLQAMGMHVTAEEAEAIGRNITGRPHFARVLRDKGYATSFQQVFRELLGERCPAYVEREDPSPDEGIRRIRAAGGLTSLAHARRLNKPDSAEEERIIRGFVDAGLDALEIYHSDHDASSRSRYTNLARKYNLAMTGGSDFHGDHKPDVLLGRGLNNHRVPLALFHNLRRRAGH
jgi:predicted metal-dependent phosphoesterase TrpH